MNQQMTEEETVYSFINQLKEIVERVVRDVEKQKAEGNVTEIDPKSIASQTIHSVLTLIDGTTLNCGGYKLIPVNNDDTYLFDTGFRLRANIDIAGELHSYFYKDLPKIQQAVCHITEKVWKERMYTHICVLVPCDYANEDNPRKVLKYLKEQGFDFVYWSTNPTHIQATHTDKNVVSALFEKFPGTYTIGKF